jgi:hypothetical protein
LAAKVVATSYAGGAFSAGDSGSEDNFLADFHGRYVGADFCDFADDVAAGNVWERDWDIWQAASDPKIEMIQCAGVDAHEYFVGADGWRGGVSVFEDFWSAVLME